MAGQDNTSTLTTQPSDPVPQRDDLDAGGRPDEATAGLNQGAESYPPEVTRALAERVRHLEWQLKIRKDGREPELAATRLELQAANARAARAEQALASLRGLLDAQLDAHERDLDDLAEARIAWRYYEDRAERANWIARIEQEERAKVQARYDDLHRITIELAKRVTP
jgi:hypothetical protein